MKSSVSTFEQPVLQAAPVRHGFLARLRRALGLHAPTREEIRQRMMSKPGLIDSIGPETLEYLRNYDGPENSGPPLTRREQQDLQRRLSESRR